MRRVSLFWLNSSNIHRSWKGYLADRFTVRDSGSAGTHLWESSADGRNPHPLSFGWKTAAPQWGGGESAGDWTPDGRYFVFRAAHDGVERLWAIRENTSWLHRGSSAPVQLYSSPDRIGTPRFSPDGKKIFFVIYQERRELVRYDSAQRLFVPYLSGIPARLLSFSKDGKWVTYRSDTDGALWRSRADGTEKLQLTFSPMVAYHSTWSPDGKRIVFGATLPGQEAKLYWVSPDGGTPEALTASNGTDGGPSYSPDAALNDLAVARQHLGSLDKITRIVRLGVSVATSGDVCDQPKVADAAWELLEDVFGKDKSPCRLVYVVASLPLGTPVELEVIFEVSA